MSQHRHPAVLLIRLFGIPTSSRLTLSSTNFSIGCKVFCHSRFINFRRLWVTDHECPDKREDHIKVIGKEGRAPGDETDGDVESELVWGVRVRIGGKWGLLVALSTSA